MLNNNELRITVVGAGIAGLTLAAALSRAGIRCDVFEQTRHLREVGAGVQLAPNASRLLHRLGLANYLDTVAVRPAGIEMRRWDDNRTLRRTELGDTCERIFGAPYQTVHRVDLHQGLLNRLGEGMVHLGMQVTEIGERGRDVLICFADGSSTTADLVVGSDGIHSAVRENLITDEPTFSGQSIYRALVDAEKVPFLVANPKVVLWLGPEQHCVSYPVSAGGLISFGATVPATEPTAESWSATASVDDLAAHYVGWHDDVRQLMSAAEVVNKWDLYDREPLERWSGRRATLVGDAAHPMLPFFAQGANQAIEDACALAVCLSQVGRDELPAALRRYERVRLERTLRVHTIARRNATQLHLAGGAWEKPDDAGARSRLREQEWLFGYDAESAAA